ncbi:MAG: NAD(P)/FAD-dependent oxidoreductase [Bacilli bacterium]
MQYDIAIVGTGPAGVSAAITAKIRNKSLLLIGSKNLTKKINGEHYIENYPGFPHAQGNTLTQAFQDHLNQLGIEITEGRVAAIYSMTNYFVLQMGEEMIEAKTVILASGVVNSSVLEGEESLLGRGVSYCATCDGNFYKNKEVAVISYSKEEEGEAEYLYQLASHLTYYKLYKDPSILNKDIEIRETKPLSLSKESGKIMVQDSQETKAYDGLFILKTAIAPDKLVPGLKIEKNHVTVDRSMQTNIPGLFSAGDITGLPYQYVKSAGEGNVAALSAVAYLDKLRRNEK